jgi:hypothetical protein
MKTLSMKYVMLAAITALAVGAAGTARADNEQSPNSAVGPAYSRAVTEVTDKTNAKSRCIANRVARGMGSGRLRRSH